VLPPNGARGSRGVDQQPADAADREEPAVVGSAAEADGLRTGAAESASPSAAGRSRSGAESGGEGGTQASAAARGPAAAAGQAFRRLIPRRAGRSPASAGAATSTGGPGSGSPVPRQQRAPGRLAGAFSADIARGVFARLSVLPAVLILAWLIPAVPLLLAGDFSPVPMLLISVPLAVALCVNGLRVVPASWPRLLSAGRTREAGWTAWFGLLATVAIVAGLTGWQLTEGSQALVVLRDPGTYTQAAYWIANHGSLPIPDALAAFGGAHPGMHFATTGFLARGTSLYPAGAPGLPALLAGAFWVHGTGSATAFPPVLGGLATLAFAGLVARLVGSQWAPAGALVLGLSLPQQYVSRTSLPETALEIMLFGGLCLLADSLALRGFRPAAARAAAGGKTAGETAQAGPPGTAAPAAGAAAAGPASPGPSGEEATAGGDTAVLPAPIAAPPLRELTPGLQAQWLVALRQLTEPRHWAWISTPPGALALLAGLSLSFGLVISLTGLVYLVAAIPFACVLLVGRRQQALPFLIGSGLGVCYGILGCFLLDRPFFDSVGETVALSGVLAVWLIALAIAATQLARLGRVRRLVPAWLAKRPLRWLPEAGALLALAVLACFAIRPYVQTVHGHPSLAEYKFVAALQRLQGLRVDPTRVYSEQTFYWVIWYIGLPTVLLGAVGLVIVLRRSLRALVTWRDPAGAWREWGLPLAVICGGSAVALWAPDISPDQPWASRRLVVMVIPGLILFALWAASWLGRRARDRGARPLTAALASAFCVAAMLVPTVATTFGLGFSHSGRSGGLKPVAQGLALTKTGAGENAAVASMCAQIPHGASIVIVGWPTASGFAQVLRGMCGVPVAWMTGRSVADVDNVLGAIATKGRHPLLIAGSERALAGYGGSPVRVLDLSTTEDPHELVQVPTVPQHVHFQVWMTSPVTPGVGT